MAADDQQASTTGTAPAGGRPPVALTVNGTRCAVALPRATPLLAFLRNDFGLNGPKFGCGLGECGACAVLIDNVAARSCVLTLAEAEGRTVTTLEGLAPEGTLGPVQAAFVAQAGSQCGYCLNGMIITATAFLAACSCRPSEAEIREALRYNLCRCGAHLEIVASVRAAAEALFP